MFDFSFKSSQGVSRGASIRAISSHILSPRAQLSFLSYGCRRYHPPFSVVLESVTLASFDTLRLTVKPACVVGRWAPPSSASKNVVMTDVRFAMPVRVSTARECVSVPWSTRSLARDLTLRLRRLRTSRQTRIAVRAWLKLERGV